MQILEVEDIIVGKEGQGIKLHVRLFSHDETQFKKQVLFLQQCTKTHLRQCRNKKNVSGSNTPALKGRGRRAGMGKDD